jgi:electron transport complex protein RnfB
MTAAISVLVGIVALLSALLVYAERRVTADDQTPVDYIEALLPRIQCGQCGYPGCRPYAEALVDGTAGINLCPPGGNDTINALAAALGRDPQPLRSDLGRASLDNVATIEEALCIGCGLCLPVCPVDAIIGVSQMMHTVLRERCTGCELCVAPCPVDCITIGKRCG